MVVFYLWRRVYNERQEVMKGMDKVQELIALLEKNRNGKIAVVTGAGVSTDSGIPDFRSAGGLWSRFDIELLTRTALYHNTEAFYQNFGHFIAMLKGKEPNVCHLALAELEQAGYIEQLVTQNIDGLHQQAGSRKVLEAHGNIQGCSCTRCGAGYPMEETERFLRQQDFQPLSSCCSALLRPDVVLFEDQLPETFHRFVQQELPSYALTLFIGTSLTVYPVAAMPRAGVPFVIINKTSTPFDRQSQLVVRDPIGEVFAAVRKWLQGPL